MSKLNEYYKFFWKFHSYFKNDIQINWSGNSIKLLKLRSIIILCLSIFIYFSIHKMKLDYKLDKNLNSDENKSYYFSCLLTNWFYVVILCRCLNIKQYKFSYFFISFLFQRGLFWLFEEQNEFLPVIPFICFDVDLNWQRFESPENLFTFVPK